MNFYQVFILASGNYRRKNLIKDVIIHNSAPKLKKKITFLSRHNIFEFVFHENGWHEILKKVFSAFRI